MNNNDDNNYRQHSESANLLYSWHQAIVQHSIPSKLSEIHCNNTVRKRT